MINTDLGDSLRNLILESGIFLESWYVKQYPGVASSGLKAIDHYLKYGYNIDIKFSPFINIDYYKEKNSIIGNDLDCVCCYLNNNDDMFSEHHLDSYYEYTDGRKFIYKISHLNWIYDIISESGLLDEDWYLEKYPDVALSGMDPIEHYIKHGSFEARWPNQFFDPSWYERSYRDTQSAFHPLLNFIIVGDSKAYSTCNDLYYSILPGKHNRRRPVPETLLGNFLKSKKAIEASFLFERDWYLEQYPNVRASGGDPLMHYLLHGVDEMRNPNKLFDTTWYLTEYREVSDAGHNPLSHYIIEGSVKGYRPHPFFPIDNYRNFERNTESTYQTPLRHFLYEVIAKGQDKVPVFSDYDVFRLTEQKRCSYETDNLKAHILTMKVKPKFHIFIVGSDHIDREKTAASLDEQIYREFSAYYVSSFDSINFSADNPNDYFILLLSGDSLLPYALYHMASCIFTDRRIDIIYTDHEELDGKNRYNVFHKPDWSPDLLESYNYIKTCACYSYNVVKSIRSKTTCEYDVLLRVTEYKTNVHHIRSVLMSLSVSARDKMNIEMLELAALEGRLQRTGRTGKPVKTDLVPKTYNLNISSPSSPLVSIVIPTAARIIKYNGKEIDLISQCVDSIIKHTNYPNVEIVIVDNGDLNYSRIPNSSRVKIRFISYLKQVFNMSEKMNLGVISAFGEFIITFNDDIVIISPNWIDTMLAHFEKEHVGMVGGRLLYPDNTLQHVGMIMVDGFMHHLMSASPANDGGHGNVALTARNCLAVTGAAAMIRKSIYLDLGGYDPDFPVDFNDTDLCFKVREAGYSIVYEPACEMYHYHAVSAQRTPRPNDLPMFWKKWRHVPEDPYYNQSVFDRFPPFSYRFHYNNRGI